MRSTKGVLGKRVAVIHGVLNIDGCLILTLHCVLHLHAPRIVLAAVCISQGAGHPESKEGGPAPRHVALAVGNDPAQGAEPEE